MAKRTEEIDWTRPENIQAMKDAFARVESEFGKDYPVLIAGKECWGNEWIESRDPADSRRLLGRVSVATEEQVDQAVRAAEHAFDTWCLVPAKDRARALEAVSRKLDERKFYLTAWLADEISKAMKEGMKEVREARYHLTLYAEKAIEYAKPRRSDLSTEVQEILNRFVPRGPLAGFSPSNFPLSLLAEKPSMATAAGCSTVIKPSPLASISGWHTVKCFSDAFAEVGAPPGLISYLPGGADVGDLLVRHTDIAQISFTGSFEAGVKIYAVAASTPGKYGLKRMDPELGGNNPMIIHPTAADDQSIADVVESFAGNKGEKCSHLGTLILLEGVPESWLQKLLRALRSLKFGHPRDEFRYGAVHEDAWKRLGVWMEDLRNVGATFEMDQKLPQGVGRFFGPVVVSDVPHASHLSREEIFGLILRVVRVKDMEQALRVANASGYALTAGIEVRGNKNNAGTAKALLYFLNHIRAGNPYVNRPLTAAPADFGGYGRSGLGCFRAGADDRVLFCMDQQTIVSNRESCGALFDKSSLEELLTKLS